MSRRTFVALSAAAPLAFAAGKKIPIGLELFSVRDALMKDLPGTVSAVAKMGYEVVEFYAPYFSWTTDYAKNVAETAGRSRDSLQFHAQQHAFFHGRRTT